MPLARRPDHDGDGDHDQFDVTIEDLLYNPGLGMGDMIGAINDVQDANAVHEFMEDVGELFDGISGNDSFFDGGLGENDQTPTDAPGTTGGAPAYLVVDGAEYTFHGGNFTYIGGGSGPRWGGGGDGDMDIFGTPP